MYTGVKYPLTEYETTNCFTEVVPIAGWEQEIIWLITLRIMYKVDIQRQQPIPYWNVIAKEKDPLMIIRLLWRPYEEANCTIECVSVWRESRKEDGTGCAAKCNIFSLG